MPRPLRDAESTQGYIADRLSTADRAAFEERLVNDVSLIRDVEDSLRLREGLELLREDRALRRLRPPRRMHFFVGVASAAALALVAVIYRGHDSWRSSAVIAASLSSLGADANAPLTVTAHYSFAAMRSAAEIPTISLPNTGALELRALTPAAGANRGFRLALDANGPAQPASRIGTVDRVMPDAEGFVAIYVNIASLPAGDYALNVEPDAAGESTGERFEFRLQRPHGAASTNH